MTALLELAGVSVRYGARVALSQVSFAIHPGEVWAVLGSNGAGKSSLVRAITGLVPMEGRVSLQGVDAATLTAAERAQRLTWVPQELPVEVQFSALEVVLLAAQGHSWRAPSSAAVEKAREALGQVGLSDRTETPVAQLSGGERRRVWLARAFFTAQRVLVLDEPTAFLDVAQQRSLLRQVAARAAQGLGVLAVVHDVSLVHQVATHAVLLKAGRVMALGPAAQVLSTQTLSALYDTPMREVSAGVFLPE